MKLIDTHTHLYVEAFDDDRDLVIERAVNAGISKFYIPAIDCSYTQRMLHLEAAYPDIICLMMGLHPTHVKENYKEELSEIKKMFEQRDFCAIGEIGIDLYWDKSFLKQQQDAFHFQIGLAKEKGKPIVIHCRNAFDEVFEILEEHKGSSLRGIFHCFTGNVNQARRAVNLNLKLGIGGVITFKNGKIDQFLNAIPLEHIVLETDAPYLAPIPYRGKRNESSYLPLILERVADIYEQSVKVVAEITTQNAEEIFNPLSY